MPKLIAFLAAPAATGTFGGRDVAGLIFLAVAIIAIWAGFLHMQGLTERADEPPAPPP